MMIKKSLQEIEQEMLVLSNLKKELIKKHADGAYSAQKEQLWTEYKELFGMVFDLKVECIRVYGTVAWGQICQRVRN